MIFKTVAWTTRHDAMAVAMRGSAHVRAQVAQLMRASGKQIGCILSDLLWVADDDGGIKPEIKIVNVPRQPVRCIGKKLKTVAIPPSYGSNDWNNAARKEISS
jgi:hypothetical protein